MRGARAVCRACGTAAQVRVASSASGGYGLPQEADRPPRVGPGDVRTGRDRRMEPDGLLEEARMPPAPYDHTADRGLPPTDAYAVLGIVRSASGPEVRSAWRRAARATHPDTGGDTVAFCAASEAYRTLDDPARRAAHDLLLEGRLSGQAASSAGSGVPSAAASGARVPRSEAIRVPARSASDSQHAEPVKPERPGRTGPTAPEGG